MVADRAGNRFIAELRRNPQRLDEHSFRGLVDAIRATAAANAEQSTLAGHSARTLWAVCSMARQWAIHPDGVLRRTGMVRPRELMRLAGWIDMLEYEVALAWGADRPPQPLRVPHVPAGSQEACTFAAVRAERARAARSRRALRCSPALRVAEAEVRILRHANPESEGVLGHLRCGLVLESDFDQLVEAFHAADDQLPRSAVIPRGVAIAAWETLRLARLWGVHPRGELRLAGILTGTDAVRLQVLLDDLQHEGAVSMFAS
jgi:hypothetical protein